MWTMKITVTTATENTFLNWNAEENVLDRALILLSVLVLKLWSRSVLDAASWFLWSPRTVLYLHKSIMEHNLLSNWQTLIWGKFLLFTICQTIYKWKGVWRLYTLLATYEVLGNKEAMMRSKWCWLFHFVQSDSAYILIMMHPMDAISCL